MAALGLVAPGPGGAYEIMAVADGGALTGTVIAVRTTGASLGKFVPLRPRLSYCVGQ